MGALSKGHSARVAEFKPQRPCKDSSFFLLFWVLYTHSLIQPSPCPHGVDVLEMRKLGFRVFEPRREGQHQGLACLVLGPHCPTVSSQTRIVWSHSNGWAGQGVLEL